MEFINQIFEFKVEPFLLFLYLYFCLWPIVFWDHLFCNLSYEWQGLWIIEVSNFSIATMIPIWIIPKSKGYGPRIKTNDLVLLRSVLFVKSFGSVEIERCFFTYWHHRHSLGFFFFSAFQLLYFWYHQLGVFFLFAKRKQWRCTRLESSCVASVRLALVWTTVLQAAFFGGDFKDPKPEFD